MKKVTRVDYEIYLDKWEKRLDDQFEKDLKLYGRQEAWIRFQRGIFQLQDFSYEEYYDMVLGRI